MVERWKVLALPVIVGLIVGRGIFEAMSRMFSILLEIMVGDAKVFELLV